MSIFNVYNLIEGPLSAFIAFIENVVKRGDVDSIAHILETYKDGNDRAAIHFATTSNQLDIVLYILKEYPAAIAQRDIHGYTPLCLAVLYSNVSIADELVKHGSDVNEDQGVSSSSSHDMESTPPKIIHVACTKGVDNMLRWLVSHGANIHEPSSIGTPLNCAAGDASDSHYKCVKFLIDGGCNVNQSCHGVSPILVAVIAGAHSVVKLLIEKGADLSVTLPGGVTPLHIACESGAIDTVKVFLQDDGTNATAVNRLQLLNSETCDIDEHHHKVGLKPIHYAAGRKHRDVVDYLLPLTPGLGSGVTSEKLILEQAATGDWDEPLDITQAANVLTLPRATAEQVELAKKEKEIGNKCFLNKDWAGSLAAYTNAIELNPHEAVYWLNRSAVYLHLNDPKAALRDARTSRVLDPTSVKAAYREALAHNSLSQFEEASYCFYEACQLVGDTDAKQLNSLRTQMLEAVGKAKEQHMTKK